MEITDGTTSVTIMSAAGSATAYTLVYAGWAPDVPMHRKIIFGNVYPFENFDVELSINIKGNSADDLMNNLEKLVLLLNQAQDNYNDVVVNPVLFKYQVKGSALSSAQQALIVGYGDRDTKSTELPSEFDESGTIIYVRNVRVRFQCLSPWINASESASGSAQNSGTLWTITPPSTQTCPCPIDIQFTGLGSTASATPTMRAFLLVAKDSSQLTVLEAANGTAANFTSVADATPKADGNVLRYTSPNTIRQSSGKLNLGANSYKSRRLAVFATIRQNAGSRPLYINAYGQGDIGTQTNTRSQQILLFEDNTFLNIPIPVFVGMLYTPTLDATNHIGFTDIGIEMQTPNASGSPTYDIDTIVVLGLDDDYSMAPYIEFVFVDGTNPALKFKSNALVRPFPEVVRRRSSGNSLDYNISYDGNIALLSTSNTFVMCLLGTSVGASVNFWRWVDGAATPALMSLTPALTRYKSNLTPR
jgi:hypothetical protein